MLPVELELRISKLKEEHSEVILLRTEFNKSELVIVSRPLTFSEFIYFTDLSQRSEESAVHEVIFMKCFITAYNTSNGQELFVDEVPVGVPATLGLTILEDSGFGDIDAFKAQLNTHRNIIGSAVIMSFIFIMKAFPQYKLSDLQKMPMTDLSLLIAMSEASLGTPFELKEDIVSDEEEGRKVVEKVVEEARLNSKYLSFEEMAADNEQAMN